MTGVIMSKNQCCLIKKIHKKRLLAATISGLICTQASAVGFIINPTSQLTGIANAGSAVYDKSTAVININPAAMSLMQYKQMGGNLSLVIPDWEIDEGWDCRAENNCADSNVSPISAIPTFGIIRPLDNDITWGIGAGAIAGAGLDYGSKFKSRTIATKNSLQVLSIINSLSWRMNDKWTFGMGLGIIYGTFEQDMDLPTLNGDAGHNLPGLVSLVGDALDCSGPPAVVAACRAAAIANSGIDIESTSENIQNLSSYLDGERGTKVELEGDDLGAELIVGATYQYSPEHRFGFAYHYMSDFTLEGHATIKGKLLSDEERQKQTSSLTWDMPQRLIISGSHMLTNEFNLYWDFERVFFDTFDSTDVRIDDYPTIVLDRNFKDANRYALGGEYQYNDKWIMQMGVSYDESPVEDEDRVADLPVDEIKKVSFGGIYQYSTDLSIHGYLSLEFLGDSKIEQLASIDGHKVGKSVQMESDAMLYVLGVSFAYRF